MGRRPEPRIAAELLEACTDVVLARGLPDRLEPFVAGTGTSARMLLYHFGTRDDLRRAVLRRARERQRAFFGDLLRVLDDEPYPTTLRRAWSRMTGPEGRPYLAVFGRLREDVDQRLWPGFRAEATTDWLAPLATGLASVGLEHRATLTLAVIRGLVMDLEATGDRRRVDAAFDQFAACLAREVATGA